MWKYLRGRNFLTERAGWANVCTVLRPASLVMELEATTVLEISRGRSHSSLPRSLSFIQVLTFLTILGLGF